MTIKIKAPRAWVADVSLPGLGKRWADDERPVRIVREADWRKLMKLVRACEGVAAYPFGPTEHEALVRVLDALKGAK